MVTWFIAELQRGSSRVQQMIMGAGKTTVVGPLLCLMLADGHTLVTQVMPTPLLEQTRNVLRSRFNVIVTKPGEREQNTQSYSCNIVFSVQCSV